jgi:hypothetical protein
MASTTAPALIGIDPTFLAGNDRSVIPQFTAPITVTGGVRLHRQLCLRLWARRITALGLKLIIMRRPAL